MATQDTTSKATKLGARDGKAARARLARRGRAFTALGAAKASGDGLLRHMDRGTLSPESAVEYGTAFLSAALG